MTCDGCAKSVSDSLYKLDGIDKVEANVKDQIVSVEGTGEFSCEECELVWPCFFTQVTDVSHLLSSVAAPSAIVEAIQTTGRDAILRGSGSSNCKCAEFPEEPVRAWLDCLIRGCLLSLSAQDRPTHTPRAMSRLFANPRY